MGSAGIGERRPAPGQRRWRPGAIRWPERRAYTSRMSTPAAAAYAKPDVLVSTEWLAGQLDNPSIRVIESNEDTLLYASGHIPGAAHVDWTADLNDQIRRDYITRRVRNADVAHRRDARHDHRLLRRQEQLVGDLRVLGLPAVRPHQGQDPQRRPPEVGEGRPRDEPRDHDLRPLALPGAGAQRQDHPRLPRRGLEGRPGERPGRRAQPRRAYSGKRLHMPDYPNEGRCAAATFRAPGACRGPRPSTSRTARSRASTS